jgi:exopolysaccharide biosynthesis polyprenyl glycosylphosphotransferase
MVTEPILLSEVEVKRVQGHRAAANTVYAQASELLARPRIQKLLLVTTDVFVLVVAHYAVVPLTGRFAGISGLPILRIHPLFHLPFFIALLYLFGAYKNIELRRPERELEVLLKSISFSLTALWGVTLVLAASSSSPRVLATWYVLTLVGLLVSRFSFRAMYAALWRHGFARQRVLWIGSPRRLADFERRLSIQRHCAYDLGDIVLEGPPERDDRELPGKFADRASSAGDWEEIAEAAGAQLVIIDAEQFPANGNHRMLEIASRCREKGIAVEIYSRLFGAVGLSGERDEFSGNLHLSPEKRSSRAVQRAVKAFLDIVIGLVGSGVTLALTPIVGFFIKLEDGGPIFHRRDYVGTDGRIHEFLKFRTMVQDADRVLENNPVLQERFKLCLKLKDDPRVLRAGRFLRKYSLDEFPQFFSVLAGQLTFVGPRAITSEARERYGKYLPRLLSVKPGLTGFWQTMGRQTTTYEEKIQMDMFYVENWSIWLDLVIIAKTFRAVLTAKGAY